jgi:hypothetical protein
LSSRSPLLARGRFLAHAAGSPELPHQSDFVYRRIVSPRSPIAAAVAFAGTLLDVGMERCVRRSG